jgi:hypothetical protein
MSDSFYQALGDGRFASTPAVVGPWDARSAHGSPPAALLLHVLENATPRTDVRVAQLCYDFFGPVPASEITVTSEVVRPGARIDLSRARLSAGGRTAMEASAWRIAAGPGRVPEVADAREIPKLPGPQPQRFFVDLPSFGYGEALEWRFVDGGFDRIGPATVFARPRIPLVAGRELTPLERLMLMVDSANGISGELSPARFTFVPVSLTVTLRRHPRTEWTGMRARTTIDADGVGQCDTELFDEAGFLGTALQSLFVAAR